MFQLSFFFMMINSLITIFTWHPLKMAIIVFSQTVLTCLVMLNMTKSSWLPYILLLAFVGGLLILFSYMTIIASNEMIKINLNMFLTYMSMFMIFFMMMTFFFKNTYMWTNLENLNLSFKMTINKNLWSMIKLFNNFSYLMNFMLMNYLLVTLIVSNKIINIYKGPLRKLN